MNARSKTTALLVIAVLLAVVGGFIAFTAFRQIEAAAETRKHSYTLINQANGLLSELRDAETGQRGYVLTGDPVFLEPYLKVQTGISGHLQALDQLTQNPQAQHHLDKLAPLIAAKLAKMAEIIDLGRQLNMTPALASAAEMEGKRIMDSIRTEMGSFVYIEENTLAQNEANFQATLRRLFGIMVIASLFTVLFAGWFAYLIYLQSRQQLNQLVYLKTQDLLKLQEQTNTLLMQANFTLQVNEEKLAVTLKSIGDAVIATDTNACVTLLNPVAEQLTGWTDAEAYGRPIDEIFHIINQETRQAVTTPIMAALAHGTVQGLANHTVLIARDGTEYAIADSCAPIRARDNQVVGAVLVFRDVTAEYAVQQAMRDSVTLVHSVFNTVVDGIITLHANGGVVASVNPATERMFGYGTNELIGQNITILIPEFEHALCTIDLLSANTPTDEGGLSREVLGRRKDGKLFPLEMAVSEMGLGGQRFFTGTLRDNTARKGAEAERALLYQELQNKNVELEIAKGVAEKANFAKSDFLSSMSHELRTPLNAILGFAQLMGSNPIPLTDLQKVSVAQILQAGWYLLELINEILDLALIESGRLSLSPEPVSLNDVLNECQAMIAAQAQHGGIRLSFPQLHSPRFVAADHTRVKQVLINLLSNAIKYNCANGMVNVKCSGNIGGRIRISIEDTGAGLSPEQLTQLFQPFNRLGQETSDKEGTGIGLVVSKRLIELMGGNIGVDSSVGVGSVFWIELNSCPAPQLAPMDAVGADWTTIATDDSQYTVLCVEDNPANLLLMASLLARRPDLRLLTATDGYSGIKLAHAQRPDIILMDINLPGISGIEALRILSEDPVTALIPVIAISANAMPLDIEKGLQAGFFSYLTKPIKINEFMDTLDQALKLTKTLAIEDVEVS